MRREDFHVTTFTLSEPIDHGGWRALLDAWRRRLRDRRELMAMSDRDLKDIHLTRYDVLFEARKPFWRA